MPFIGIIFIFFNNSYDLNVINLGIICFIFMPNEILNLCNLL